MGISWVEEGWIFELTIVVFGVESGSSVIGNNNEVVDSLSVGDVLVEVILEVLKHVHVLLDEVISSDLLEWESVVIKFPGVDLWVWILALLLKFSVDGHGSVVMLLLERSGEVVHFNVHLGNRDFLTSWGWNESIWIWVVAIVGWEWHGLRSGGDSDKASVFHVNYFNFIINLYIQNLIIFN